MFQRNVLPLLKGEEQAARRVLAPCLLFHPKDKSNTFLQSKLLSGYIRSHKTVFFLKAPLNGSLSALPAIFKRQHIPAVAVLSYF